MKKLTILIFGFVILGLLISCGSKGNKAENNTEKSTEENVITTEDVSEAKEALDKIKTERERSKKASEKLKGMSAEEFGLKTLKAVQELDLDTVKSMVGTGMAINMDMEFLKGEKEDYLQNWDGTIKGVKYRKAMMTGLPQAVIYYKDKDDQNIMVHILKRIEDRWYAFGGAYGFEEISKEEYEGYVDELKEIK